LEESEKTYRQSLALRTAIVTRNPGNTAWRHQLVQGYVNLGALYARSGRLAEAETELKKAEPLAKDNVAAAASEPDYQHALAAVYSNLAGVEMLLGRFDESLAAYNQELPTRERLVTDHPNVLEYRLMLGSTYTNLGELEIRQRHPAVALPWLTRAIATFDWVLARAPKHSTSRFYQSYTLAYQAQAFAALQRYPEAVAAWQRAISFDDRNDPELRKGLEAAKARARE
jgi:tetratricopeptide (TPR) repeat protein